MTPTNDSKHAGGFGGLGVAFIFRFIVEDRLAYDENTFHSFRNDLIFFAFSDFTTVFEPANLFRSLKVSDGFFICYMQSYAETVSTDKLRSRII